MKLLEQIETEAKPAPRRVMLYGVHGVGKSTWGAATPEPIFIQTEDYDTYRTSARRGIPPAS